MVMPGKEDSVKLDFSKNYFESVQDEDSNEENKKEDKGEIITKIFGFNK